MDSRVQFISDLIKILSLLDDIEFDLRTPEGSEVHSQVTSFVTERLITYSRSLPLTQPEFLL